MAEEAPIDFVYLDSQTFGDLALRHELLDVFAAQLPLLLARIEPSFGQDALLALHTLKGAARAMGARPLAAAAAALEQALHEGRPWQEELTRLATTTHAACACATGNLRDRP